MDTKNIFNIITQVVNVNPSGEILEINDFSKIPIGQEDPYVKSYQNRLDEFFLSIHRISTIHVLVLLLKGMTFNCGNEIYLTKTKKKLIADRLKLSVATVEKAVQELKSKEFLFRLDRGLYYLNPNFAGMGPWPDIKAIRVAQKFGSEQRDVNLIRKDEKFLYLEELSQKNDSKFFLPSSKNK